MQLIAVLALRDRMNTTDSGTTLSQRLLATPFSLHTTLRPALQLATFLRRAHETGHFFGALDPAQILVLPGRVEVLVADSHESVYVAPEIRAGQRADERSDIFAFGCVLYEMVTGQKPF